MVWVVRSTLMRTTAWALWAVAKHASAIAAKAAAQRPNTRDINDAATRRMANSLGISE